MTGPSSTPRDVALAATVAAGRGHDLAATTAPGEGRSALAATAPGRGHAARIDDEAPAERERGALAGRSALAVTAPGRGHAALIDDEASAELERGALIGRYVVLSKLGAGGMGVVNAAYDPELDRKVAIKLLHPRLVAGADPFTTHEARTRLVREAQALAKLNHPHIVGVHDVGVHAGAVWLAMEYVEGETLSAWLKQRRRTWREVLDVLIPAARGLAAAHDAGLVHRDIKPDNIMIGGDGRVRVMDLGLARALDDAAAPRGVPGAPPTADFAGLFAQVTQAGSLLGTPAYMSPEQFRGEAVDVRADVFSFCVVLWEGLMGERPFAGDTLSALEERVLAGRVSAAPKDAHSRRVPGWLRRVCVQGLAVAPERRFASMPALLAALSRGRTRARVRNWLVGAAAAVLVGAAVAGYRQYELGERVAACVAAGADIDTVWNDEAQAGVRAGLAATDLSYAPETIEKILPVLDRKAEDWRDQRTRACMLAEVEATLDAELMDRAVWCLDERRMDLAVVVAELSRADAMAVPQAVFVATGLPPASRCTDRQVLAAQPPPPPSTDARERVSAVRTTLSEVRTMMRLGKYADSPRQASAVLVDAEAIAWPPLTASALELTAEAFSRTGALAEAEAASQDAFMMAAAMQAWEVAAKAASHLVFTVGLQQARYAEGKVWARLAEVMIRLAGDERGLVEATRLSNLGNIHNATGAYTDAQAAFERALAIYDEVLGSAHPDQAKLLNNLANVRHNMGAYAEAKTLYERALAISETTLGPEHPDVALALHNLANVHYATGDYAKARALYEQTYAIQEKTLGPDNPDLTYPLSNLGLVHKAMGEYAEARRIGERALALREKMLGPEHSEVAASLDNLAGVHLAVGEYAEAKALDVRALAIYEKALGPEHPGVAEALGGLVSVHLAVGAYTEAKPLATRALAIAEKALGPDHPGVADALSNRGDVHRAMGEYTEAKALHERALAVAEKALGPDHPSFAEALDGLASDVEAAGGHTEAKVLYERALAIRERVLGVDHPAVAGSLGGLGALELAQGRPGTALPLLARAVAIFDAHEGVQELELAARIGLARALVRTRGDRARALAEARKAADGYRAAGEGKAKELTEAESFRAEHRL